MSKEILPKTVGIPQTFGQELMGIPSTGHPYRISRVKIFECPSNDRDSDKDTSMDIPSNISESLDVRGRPPYRCLGHRAAGLYHILGSVKE